MSNHRHRLAIRSSLFPLVTHFGVMIHATDDYWQCLDCGQEWRPDRGGPFPAEDDYRGPKVPPELQHAITQVDRARMAALANAPDAGAGG